MSENAYLPCFVCGKVMRNVFVEADNQPDEGTVFRTQGHYGSTFWDSFDGEDLVLNVCDRCLRMRSDRLGQQKVAEPVRCEGFVGFGEREVDRPLVAFTGNPDRSEFVVDVEDLGAPIPGVRWVPDIEERKAGLLPSHRETTPAPEWVRQHLAVLSGDARSAVRLMTGLSDSELEDLGGFKPE